MFKTLILCALITPFLFGIPFAKAETVPEVIGSFGKWQSFYYDEGAGKVCFVSVQPDKSEGKYSRRDPVYLMITHRPAESSKNVVSFLAGYSYKSGQEVKIKIDGQDFVLLGQDNAAWTPDAETDVRLVSALKKGSKLTVEGMSARGTVTKDSFSLKGSGDALKSIGSACSGDL